MPDQTQPASAPDRLDGFLTRSTPTSLELILGHREAERTVRRPAFPEAWAGFAARRVMDDAYDVIRAESVNAAPASSTTMPAADWSVWVLTEHDLIDPVVPIVWDFTGGAWPKMCNDQHGFKGARPGVTVRRTCTRRADHLGRHAAAAGGRIVAVWGVKHDPSLVLEVTA